MTSTALPEDGTDFVTDGGLETDLIFHHGADLPEFAAFPLLDDDDGRALLAAYYAGYRDVALDVGAGLLLETATWRANPDWGAKLGYDRGALDRVNRRAVEDLARARSTWESDLPHVLVSGQVGPRRDGYVADAGIDADEAADYHAAQLRSFAEAGADLATAYTLTTPAEAIGIVRAAREVGLSVGISFTVETDGRLPDGTALADAVLKVDEATDGAAAHFLVNCAHPGHVAPGLVDGDWRDRVAGVRVNASQLSHDELDAAPDLDEGDPAALATDLDVLLRPRLPGLRIVGGCCGTDVRHVAAMWAARSPR